MKSFHLGFALSFELSRILDFVWSLNDTAAYPRECSHLYLGKNVNAYPKFQQDPATSVTAQPMFIVVLWSCPFLYLKDVSDDDMVKEFQINDEPSTFHAYQIINYHSNYASSRKRGHDVAKLLLGHISFSIKLVNLLSGMFQSEILWQNTGCRKWPTIWTGNSSSLGQFHLVRLQPDKETHLIPRSVTSGTYIRNPSDFLFIKDSNILIVMNQIVTPQCPRQYGHRFNTSTLPDSSGKRKT